MAHLLLFSLQTALFLGLIILNVEAEYSQEHEYKLPLAAARSVRAEGGKLEAEENPQYHFRYFVNNEDTGDFKSQEESRDGKTVQGRYTVAEPTGHVREVKYTADDKNGFRADVKIHPPGTFEPKNSEKRSADSAKNRERQHSGFEDNNLKVEAEEKIDSEEKIEEVQSDKSSEEEKEDQHADETKTSEELLHNDKPHIPEEMTDEEVEKTLEKQEHILNPHEHDSSSSDDEKSAEPNSSEQTDNLIITVNAEKKVPIQDVKADTAKNPVHITHAVRDPISQPAYPFTPHFYSPYPYNHNIPHPAVADGHQVPHPAVPAVPHHIPHPAVADNHHFSHILAHDHQLKTSAPAVFPFIQSQNPAPIAAPLPTFIYHDHPIQHVNPLFIQQPSHQAHHYLPGNVQDILAAKQATLQEVENMVRHASADESKHDVKNAPHESFQIHPKPMMFQLADPPVHLLVPSNSYDQGYKGLTYLAPNYPYHLPYYYQPSQEDLARTGVPPQYFDNRNHQFDEAHKSVFSNFNFIKPIMNNLPPQFRPSAASSTAAPANADQVNSTPQPGQHTEINVNKGQQAPAPSSASSPSHYFNFPFLYPLTTFLQRPFLQHHTPQVAAQPAPAQVPQQQSQVQIQQDTDAQKIQKPAEQPMPQPMAAATPNEQQRYYFIQPQFQSGGQYRFNPGSPYSPSSQVNHPKPAAAPMKPTQNFRSQPAPTQSPVPVQNHSPQEKSSNLYSFPYNSPVALLVLPMQGDYQTDKHHHSKVNEGKGAKHAMDSYY